MRSSACYPRDFGRFVASQHINVMDTWPGKTIGIVSKYWCSKLVHANDL